jgi:cytochrome d ubiquinol oxidase subunit I
VHPSADEKMRRGRLAVNAFAEYRKTVNKDSVAAIQARQTFEENQAYFGYGHIEKKEDLVPNVTIVYWAFRIMIGFGCLLTLLLCLTLWFERRGTLAQKRWMQHWGVWSIPMVFLAGQAGWVVAEVGRQPWAIQDLMPVGVAVSGISASSVQVTFCLFLALFTILLIAEIRIMCKAIKNFRMED